MRIELDDGIYHVTARGCERRVLVRDDRDRQEWFKLLDRVVVRCGWRFFAWVLMDNHFHLFFQTPEANLSAGMQAVNSGYATWFNRRHQRAESLLQGRFKAILVEDESYGWTLSRYINPIRARMVERPEDHPWSSYQYQYYLRSRKAPEWLDWQGVLAKRIKNKNNCTRVAALYLIRKITSVSATQLARQYGSVGQAAISKIVQRAEVRWRKQRRWKQRLARLPDWKNLCRPEDRVAGATNLAPARR